MDNYGVCEIVEINGERYLVKVYNLVDSQDAYFNKYCLDNIKEFNELNNAKIVET